MQLISLISAPLLAVITAFTVSTSTDVKVNRIFVPAVVFGSGEWEMQDDRLSSNAQDVTAAQIEAAKARVLAAGFAPDRLQTWTQGVHAGFGRSEKQVRIGIIMIDLGTPAEARSTAPAITKLNSRDLHFGWNQFVGVDCSAMERRIATQLRSRAQEQISVYAGLSNRATIRSLKPTTDPRIRAFAPVPLCPAGRHPIVHSAGGSPPTFVRDAFTQYASANVELAYAADASASPPPATSVFPFGTFGFPVPIIGHQNRAFVLRGGRFAATPGASQIATPADGALVVFTYREPEKYTASVSALQHLAIRESDYATDDGTRQIYIRMRPVTSEMWAAITPIAEDTTIYRFLQNCLPYERYAHAAALERSRGLAQAAAGALQISLGPLVLETDWAGPSSDTTCGSDGSGEIRALMSFAKRRGTFGGYDAPYYADFWASEYAAWTLGAHTPAIAAQSIVERLEPVVRAQQPGVEVNGTATLAPDAFFYEDRTANDFTTTVVASRADIPSGHAAGNVVTNCDAAQQRAVANAVKVAQLDQPIRSVYVEPARFLSIACLSRDLIGRTFSSLPTVYNESSPTGQAQVTQTIEVFR